MNITCHHILPAIIAALLLSVTLTGCRIDRLESKPVERKKLTYALLFATRSGDTEGTDGTLDTDSVTISGLGTYEAGSTAKVTVSPKEGYQCDGIYFGYTSGYDAATFPVTKETALKVSEVTFEVKGNITVKAMISEVEKPIVQPDHYEKNVLINEAYWREQNRKAWADIHPQIIRLSYEEALNNKELLAFRKDGDVRVFHSEPGIFGLEETKTIYRNEPTVMCWTIALYVGEKKDKPDVRIAYALANRGGDLVEIYPPIQRKSINGCIASTVVFPTVPEGEYEQRVLVNIVGSQNWYDLPIVMSPLLSYTNPEYIVEKTKSTAISYAYQFGVLREEDNWYSDDIRSRRVSERNSISRLPVPRWHSWKNYCSTIPLEEEILKRNSGSTLASKLNTGWWKSTTIELTNGCNQVLEGRIIAYASYNTFINKNKEAYIDIHSKLWQKADYSKYGNRYIIGEAEVKLEPNTVDQTVVIPIALSDSGAKPLEVSFVFFWQPKDSSDLYFMGEDNHNLLNEWEHNKAAVSQFLPANSMYDDQLLL